MRGKQRQAGCEEGEVWGGGGEGWGGEGRCGEGEVRGGVGTKHS